MTRTTIFTKFAIATLIGGTIVPAGGTALAAGAQPEYAHSDEALVELAMLAPPRGKRPSGASRPPSRPSGGHASRPGGGGGHASRPHQTRPASGHAGNMQVRHSSPQNVNHRPPNRNNTNINNVNVNRNVNVQGGGGYHGGGCCYYGGDWDDDDDNFGVGLAVGAVTGAIVGAAASSSSNNTTTVVTTGSVVTALPSGCSATVVNNYTYQQCGSVWYQPQYSGSTVQYVVVNPPR
ncbi:hypothetical protein SAMN06295912_11071 [Sphingomonas laterariae]|uniref:Glycine zipper 2TM domain-containing protein n=1 Tax=Edaphosphingomonas laterariae TaxID=861865 RepID=A0A239FZL0_9SPHN|nr:hypothetical protein [Sphingomonas laterariae]SNS61204.1 hypothetical protein SAMN06295912_11071 [Sphingomonas laterariae]